jgi:hypothetical protein
VTVRAACRSRSSREQVGAIECENQSLASLYSVPVPVPVGPLLSNLSIRNFWGQKINFYWSQICKTPLSPQWREGRRGLQAHVVCISAHIMRPCIKKSQRGKVDFEIPVLVQDSFPDDVRRVVSGIEYAHISDAPLLETQFQSPASSETRTPQGMNQRARDVCSIPQPHQRAVLDPESTLEILGFSLEDRAVPAPLAPLPGVSPATSFEVLSVGTGW